MTIQRADDKCFVGNSEWSRTIPISKGSFPRELTLPICNYLPLISISRLGSTCHAMYKTTVEVRCRRIKQNLELLEQIPLLEIVENQIGGITSFLEIVKNQKRRITRCPFIDREICLEAAKAWRCIDPQKASSILNGVFNSVESKENHLSPQKKINILTKIYSIELLIDTLKASQTLSFLNQLTSQLPAPFRVYADVKIEQIAVGSGWVGANALRERERFLKVIGLEAARIMEGSEDRTLAFTELALLAVELSEKRAIDFLTELLAVSVKERGITALRGIELMCKKAAVGLDETHIQKCQNFVLALIPACKQETELKRLYVDVIIMLAHAPPVVLQEHSLLKEIIDTWDADLQQTVETLQSLFFATVVKFASDSVYNNYVDNQAFSIGTLVKRVLRI